MRTTELARPLFPMPPAGTVQRNRMFAKLVRGARDTRHKTLEEVAAHLGVTITEVNDWERRIRTPPRDEGKVRRLADYLHLDADALWLVAQMEAAPPHRLCVPEEDWTLVARVLRAAAYGVAPEDRERWQRLRVMADVFEGEVL